ncbi:MAG: DNA polymerase III subunit beta [Candidatus Omnitrophica bacterium]|nr:DNA polymerase III subunit beta [Candidatus Omnitrophota bacterium]
MQIKAPKQELIRCAQSVVNATATKSTLPILSNIHLEAHKSKLYWSGTDLEIAIQTEMDAEVGETGSITVPGRKFYDIIKELSDGEIEITVRKNNTVEIECGKAYFKIMGTPSDDFPKPPELNTQEILTLPQEVLKEFFAITSFAVSHDETRYVLNGVLMVVCGGEVKVVATDGRRLSVVKRKGISPEALEKEVIIPAKTVHELNRNMGGGGNVVVHFGENQIRFDFDRTKLYSRLIEGQFPNYEQVIPKHKGKEIKIRREDFLSAVKRVSLLAGSSQPVRLELGKNRLTTSAQSGEVGEAREEVDAHYSGDAVVAGFNPGFLMDALKNIALEEISLELEDAEKPGVIRTGDDYLYVVMPMQLS